MPRSEGKAPEAPDADAGMWRGKAVARRLMSSDGMIVLVGKSAVDNDVLSIRLASPCDFWFHIASGPGSHVVVRNPDNLDRLPRETQRFAAGLAAGYSKARAGGRVAVHMARCADVKKRPGSPPGEVTLRRYSTVQVEPLRADS